jgi:hypothetical protein
MGASGIRAYPVRADSRTGFDTNGKMGQEAQEVCPCEQRGGGRIPPPSSLLTKRRRSLGRAGRSALRSHDDIWLVSFVDYDLGYFDLDTQVPERLDNPFEVVTYLAGTICNLCLRAGPGGFWSRGWELNPRPVDYEMYCFYLSLLFSISAFLSDSPPFAAFRRFIVQRSVQRLTRPLET